MTFDLELLVFFVPLASVVVFHIVEHMVRQGRAGPRVKTSILAIGAMNMGVSLALSAFLLLPFVMFLSPYQVFSFAQWDVPIFVSFIAALLFLDFTNYISHRLHHSIPLLWRLHRLHHSDREVDAMTTLLHHPLEYVSSFGLSIFLAVLFDVPVIVLTVSALLSGLHGGFSHVRTPLPEKLNAWLSRLIVTPNYHHLHHSLDMRLGNSNFAALLPIWDYLGGTVTAPQKQPKYGIADPQSPPTTGVVSYLGNPLR